MRQKQFAGTALLILTAAPAAAGQPIDFSGSVSGHLGYAVNPRLAQNRDDDGSGSASVAINSALSQSTAVSETRLSANYQREQYFTKLGHTQSIYTTLSHRQSLSEAIRIDVSTTYSNSNNVLLTDNLSDTSDLDDFSFSRKVWSLRGKGSLSWRMTGNDSLAIDTLYAHQHSVRANSPRSYDEYSGNLNYLHELNARTRVGIRTNLTVYRSSLADSTSIGPALSVSQILSPIWVFNGDVGVNIQHRDAQPIANLPSSNNTSLGFHGSLCGTYPRSSLCFTAAQQNSPTAFGGLRRQLYATVDFGYQLSPHGRISLQASATRGKANGINVINDSKILRGQISYERTLGRRLSVGAEGRGAYRKSDNFGTARSIVGSVFAKVRFE